jgi:hypothetical protein
MSAVLTLTAPPDLSVGRVRLTSGEHEIGGWIASPTEVQHRFESLEPGIYQAVAEPLGQPSRSFLFLLNEEERQVEMPSLQAMSSPGFTASNLKAVAGTMLRSVEESAAGPLQDVVEPALKAILELSGSQPVALGLSTCVDFEKESRRPYTSGPPPEITLIEGAVEVVLNRPENDLAVGSFNLLLICAVGGGRNLFGRVPLFAGGVRLALSASPLGTADLNCRVSPVDRNRRAITQALFAGSSTEAAPVFKTIPGGPEELIGREDWRKDPWTSVAACLLCFRFPDLAPDSLPFDLSALASYYPALPDVHVLLAQEGLRQAAKSAPTPQDRSAALNDALTHLQKSCDAGPPYFAYAAQLAEGMLAALATDAAVGAKATAQLTKLRRYAKAPRDAGASYVWLSAEIPPRAGTLDPHLANVVFSGWVNYDRIALDDAQRTPSVSTALVQVAAPILAAVAKFVPRLQSRAPDSMRQSWDDALVGLRDLGASASSLWRGTTSDKYQTPDPPPMSHTPLDPPALERPITDADDPHKGRFGGKDSVGGFKLTAEFTDGEDAKLVGIILSVSGESGFESYDEAVEFFLHPTFRPDRLRATFRGRKAEAQIVSWGGFTVGVWLPKHSIELELDLAKIPGAPRVVREL